ncbi:hypothetical protein [uncultured Parabacteroides sp.]|jgi:hypothetical protein|uniref:hypothetical protein n=1 Tax=uncultured Parabacteroides sp. TaxID=512312 RepID=UPI00260129BF|nr:hypothetical protein [uncultured Parabacteroides sp.]
MENEVILSMIEAALRSSEKDCDTYRILRNTMNYIKEYQPYFGAVDKVLLPDVVFNEFDFSEMIGSDKYETVTGLKVHIDKILKDVTGTTVLGIGGTLVVRGIRIRIVWDPMGNVLEYKRIASLLSPYKKFDLHSLFAEATTDMFRLVLIQNRKKDD